MGLFSLKKRNSSAIAKDRLKLLLVAERIDCSPNVLIMLKNDMIQAAEKYVVVDKKKVSITYSQSPDMLVAKLPLQQHLLKKRETKEV